MTSQTWQEDFDKQFPFEIIPLMEVVDTDFWWDCVQTWEDWNFIKTPDALAVKYFIETQISLAREEWRQEWIVMCLQLIPNERVKFLGKWDNVYQHYNIALKDTRKAINDYFNSLK
jgi:hypothetical protein